MWNIFQPKPCAVCGEKDGRINDLISQVLTLKSQLGHSREREEKAVDALLEKQGVQPVTPQPRMTTQDSENAQKQAFGLFLDEDDKGDGNILEVDRLGANNSPIL